MEGDLQSVISWEPLQCFAAFYLTWTNATNFVITLKRMNHREKSVYWEIKIRLMYQRDSQRQRLAKPRLWSKKYSFSFLAADQRLKKAFANASRTEQIMSIKRFNNFLMASLFNGWRINETRDKLMIFTNYQDITQYL